MTTAAELLDIERSKIGYHEAPPESNRNIFGVWYGFDGQPWCAMFQSWACAEVGAGGFRFAAVASAVAWAKREGLWKADPRPGYMACKLYSTTKGHIGNVESLLPGSLLDTIEGNTSVTDDRNGGTVARRRRPSSFWDAGFIEVPGIDYGPSPSPAPPPAAPAAHGPDGNPHTLMAVDGDFAPLTVKALQWSLNHTGAKPALAVDGDFGGKTRRALQARLNHVAGPIAIDGRIGKETVKALQRHAGTDQDSVWQSATTKALQGKLNDGTF